MKEKFVVLFFLFTNFILAQNVIIVVIDGARYTETFGGSGTYIPHMYSDLKPSGTLYSNFRITYPTGLTETCSGHSAIETGSWHSIANDGSERPTQPTIFEYLRKEKGNPDTDCFVVTGKTKLNILTHSTYSGYGSAYGGTWVGDDSRKDSLTLFKVTSVMQNYQPKIIVINFAEVDAAGHSGNENSYHHALTNADDLVYQLWQHIQAGDYGYTTSNTTMFITNDHGRHTTDFANHGDGCDGCEHIMLLAIGKNVSVGLENSDPHYQIDLAPTIGDLLGFSTPQAMGVSLFAGSNPLTVELSSFSAATIGSTVKLSWNTATEVNNFGFEIERSKKLDARGETWEKIGFINGNGNSNSPKNYSFVDDKVSSGKYAFRLKQIDNDGQFEYSKAIEVDFNLLKKFELSQNYPNPFNPVTTIRFTIPEASLNPSQGGTLVKLTLYNILGQQVALLVNEVLESGVHTINFNASDLNSGMYIYKIEAGNFVQTRKMTLVK